MSVVSTLFKFFYSASRWAAKTLKLSTLYKRPTYTQSHEFTHEEKKNKSLFIATRFVLLTFNFCCANAAELSLNVILYWEHFHLHCPVGKISHSLRLLCCLQLDLYLCSIQSLFCWLGFSMRFVLLVFLWVVAYIHQYVWMCVWCVYICISMYICIRNAL